MRNPVAFMLSAKTMLRVFAANNHSKSLFQVVEEFFLPLQRLDLSICAFWL